jgi:hypothetical protein
LGEFHGFVGMLCSTATGFFVLRLSHTALREAEKRGGYDHETGISRHKNVLS